MPVAVGVNLDLVHAAYNGRGGYYPATSATALQEAFSKIIQTALTQSAPGGIASAAGSGGLLSGNSMAYVSSYTYTYDSTKVVYGNGTTTWWGTGNPITGTINGWSGKLQAYAGNALPPNGSPVWSASIPAPSARNIFTANSSGTGVPFQCGVSSCDATVMGTSVTPTDVNAVRNNPLGDIVDSQLAYVDSTPSSYFSTTYQNFSGATHRNSTVYVGANDGMLHGFDTGNGASSPGTGAEVMAYVPRGLLASLHTNTFASSTYTHRYWVDGSPFSGDAQLAAPSSDPATGNWATVLAGTLAGGGPGYFVLNVTTPASSAVLIDATDAASASSPVHAAAQYIGNQFSQPVMQMYSTTQSGQIVQINTADAGGVEWAVIMGNGYNSASGLPVLLVQSLTHSGRPLYTVTAACVKNGATVGASVCKTDGNGLGAPRPIDVDGNGTADIVYAGDLEGNLWKFDISNPDHSQWKVANIDGSNNPAPLFRAVGPTGVAQPITSAPVAVADPRGGFMVAFGTGKNLTTPDTTDTNLNSVYAIYDNEKMAVTGTGTAASQVLLGSGPNLSTTSTTMPNPSPVPATCLSGFGDVRYSSCLYQQTGGDLGAANADGVMAGASGTTSNEQIDDTTYFGWYYDIPEIANGNSGKVLANPLVMPGDTLVFYSENVPRTVSGGGSVAGEATASNGAQESCNATATSGAATTVNYLDLFTGSYPDFTITIGNSTYASGKGNRFQISGVTTYIPSGTDSLSAVGQNLTITSNRTPPAGQHTGWHIGR